jgi:putative ABC transport system permease protein
MGEQALQAAFDLDGAFNDVSLSLLRGTDPEAVVDRVDAQLARYGGTGAYARADQMSNWFLMNEIRQLGRLANPAHHLPGRGGLPHQHGARPPDRGRAQRDRPAQGLRLHEPRHRLALHPLRAGHRCGGRAARLGGGLLARACTTRTLYAEFYHFPFLLFRPGPRPFAIAAVISLGAALIGAMRAVRMAAAMPPAEAMRPPAPPLFRRTALGRFAFVQRLDQPTRILLRQVMRWPGRSLITATGIAMSVAVLVTSMQWLDAINHMVNVYFLEAQGQNLTIGFAEPRSSEITRDLARLPGVQTTEPMRSVAAKMRNGWREEREALQGLPAHQQLYRVYDAKGHSLELPPEGVVISTMLAELLHVRVGDSITVEVLEGRRPVFDVPVVATFETYIGSPAYMDIRALGRLMRERPSVTAVHLRVDAMQRQALFRDLKTLPRVSSVTIKEAAVQTFRDTMAETITIFVSFFIVFSCALAFGVTYNAARISLSERGRELATLRVLGFTRAEISYILLGEVALLTFVALPLGCGLGFVLASLIVQAFETELYRVPLVILASTYGWAIVIGLAATAVSAFLVRRRVDRLDLIAVLKTRE